MNLYAWKCPSCRASSNTTTNTDPPECPICHGRMNRDFQFTTRNSLPDHFNHSVGRYVTNERDLRDELKRSSDEHSERLGVEHNFEYLSRADLAEQSSHGVTDEGLNR